MNNREKQTSKKKEREREIIIIDIEENTNRSSSVEHGVLVARVYDRFPLLRFVVVVEYGIKIPFDIKCGCVGGCDGCCGQRRLEMRLFPEATVDDDH